MSGGYWSTADSVREQSVHVRSALVSPDSSMALLRALSTVKDVHDYLIPSSDTEPQNEQAGFVLKGWIEGPGSDLGLDRKDHWSGGVHYPPPVPAPETVALMALDTDSDKQVWRNGAKTTVMFSQIWGHLEVRNQDHNPERGDRLQASVSFVKDMLGKLNRDLIIEVHIERSRRHRRYESQQDDDEQNPKATRLYLIKADGRVTAL